MKSNKAWSVLALSITAVILAAVCAVTVWADPFFHYHGPLEGISYILSNQRYQNDGIVKHFPYDAVITGTSMTENFKATEVDRIFGVSSVKVSFSGASYKEINNNLKVAFDHNPNIRLVIRALDYGKFLDGKDTVNYDTSQLNYLYDDLLYNDVKYLLNKTTFLEYVMPVLKNSILGAAPTSFDAYSNWHHEYVFGKEAILAEYWRPYKEETRKELTDADRNNIKENISENVIALAQAHPDVDFYYFITPYSIFYWDSINQTGEITRQLEAEKLVIEMLLEQENIHLFSFLDRYEIVCDLNNYKDIAHYGEDINTQMLHWMKNGAHQLTKDNYLQYWNANRDFYLGYDYDALFSGN